MRNIHRVLFFVVLATLLSSLSPVWAQGDSATKSHYTVYVGTYTTKQASKGIYAFDFDAASGQLKELGLAAESVDPSFLAVHPNGKYLYAVNETSEFGGQKGGAVSAFAIDPATRKLKLLNQVPSGGAGPCHISLDKTGKFVFVANYDGGSIASFPIRDDGSLGPASSFVQHQGSSVNKERQEAPHAHWISTSPDNRFVLTADLGLDEVLIYRFDATTGKLLPNAPPFAKLAPGSGPRHFAFHPDGKFAYVLTEMAATVTAFSYNATNGSLSPLQTTATLPKDYSGPIEAAELVVHPSGKFLYASNRGGIDTITAFAIDPTKGTLKLLNKFSTKGKTPRNFSIDPTGSFLFAANQESGNIVVFRINRDTGALTDTGQQVQVPAPVCIIFTAVDSQQRADEPGTFRGPAPIILSSLSPNHPVYKAGANGISIPECVFCPNPDYTDEARAANIEGTIRLEIVVTEEGRAEHAVVNKGLGYGLENKAIEAVRDWRLKPAHGPDGEPVAVMVPVEVTFRLYKNR